MVITVTQLNNYVKGMLDIDGNLSSLSVSGEVTNVRNAYNCRYFTLKDENSQIDCFSYINDVEDLPYGVEVVAKGSLNFLTKMGKVSFFVKSIGISDKLGAQYLKLLALQRRLQSEGLFDTERKKPIPEFCSKIGVVTSDSGAVIKDICDVVSRRQPFSDIFLYPVHVQGTVAEREITEAVKYMSNADVDVVIVARGGGSNENLSAFNAESVVRAIADCKRPTVSAIGHGIDFTLSDFAADRRAVTPSEAAEIVTTDFRGVIADIKTKLNYAYLTVQGRIKAASSEYVAALYSVSENVSDNIQKSKADVAECISAEYSTLDKQVALAALQTEKCSKIVDANNPMNLLRRGYAAIYKDDKIISSVDSLSVGDYVKVRFADGSVNAEVKSKEKN